jgi:BolA family transcriptional regulator, general stress-responsive regulator
MSPPANSAVRAERVDRIRARLAGQFSPLELSIRDESHLHEGHAGAAGGAGHFRIRIVAGAFRGLAPLARHRLIYAALSDLMPGEIHALAIEALPPPA